MPGAGSSLMFTPPWPLPAGPPPLSFFGSFFAEPTNHGRSPPRINKPIARKMSFTFIDDLADVSMNRRPLSSAYA